MESGEALKVTVGVVETGGGKGGTAPKTLSKVTPLGIEQVNPRISGYCDAVAHVATLPSVAT